MLSRLCVESKSSSSCSTSFLLSYRVESKTNLQEMQRQAVDNSKGLMSWFTADKGPPPLIPSTHLAVSFWASWFLLAIESQSYSVFYQHVFEVLYKKDKTTLDQAVRVSSLSSALILISIYAN